MLKQQGSGMASQGRSNWKHPGRGTAKHRACINKKMVTQNIFLSTISLSVYMQCLHRRTDLGREGISRKGEIHLLGSVSIENDWLHGFHTMSTDKEIFTDVLSSCTNT